MYIPRKEEMQVAAKWLANPNECPVDLRLRIFGDWPGKPDGIEALCELLVMYERRRG
jgi:hypothetical protein